MGGFQRHGNLTPFSVEAYDCGGPYLLREQSRYWHRGKPDFAVSNSRPHKGRGMNAVGSVASLEWIWRIDAQNFFCLLGQWQKGNGVLKPYLQKRIRKAQAVWENF